MVIEIGLLSVRNGVAMVSDLEIHRAANLLIHRHGADAMIEAARLLDITQRGDLQEGRETVGPESVDNEFLN